MRHPLAAVKQFSHAPVGNTAASEPAGEAGSVAEAVREQIDGLGGIAKERPGLVAGADVLAQALDNPRAQPHHAAIAEQHCEDSRRVVEGRAAAWPAGGGQVDDLMGRSGARPAGSGLPAVEVANASRLGE